MSLVVDPRNVPPYPPLRCTDDEPEVSAWLKRGGQSPTTTPPDWRGGPAGPALHRTMTEAFVVLYGASQTRDGRDWTDGHPNDFLYVPPGGIHGFGDDEPGGDPDVVCSRRTARALLPGPGPLDAMTDDERR